jgi:cyclohexanecarboxylate-CoA ligase
VIPGWHGRTTLDEALRLGAERHGATEVAFTSADGDERVRVADLWARSAPVAASMRAHGVGAGDVVAVQVPSWQTAAVLFYATARLGATILPLLSMLESAELKLLLEQSRAALYFLPAQAEKVDVARRASVAAAVPTMRAVVSAGAGELPSAISWERFVRAGDGDAADRLPPPDVAHTDRCVLLFTSGTEAAPKGVQHSHDSILAESMPPNGGVLAGHGTDGPETTLYTGPFGHVGSIMYLIWPFVSGEQVILLDRWNATVAAAAIDAFGVTFTHGPPFVVGTLMEALEAGRHDFSRLKRLRIGAAEVQPDFVAGLEREYDLRAFRAYGATEHPTISCGNERDPRDKRIATEGRPLPGNEVRIVIDGEDCPVGEDGEVWTRGPELFMSYQDPSHDADAFADGWYRTGDIGRLDADGYLTISGRIKDIIIRGGENLSTKRVEQALLNHAAVREAAVVGVPDPRYGQRAFAFLVTATGAPLTVEQLREHFVEQGVAKQYAPEYCEVVPELPRSVMGKVQRDVLRAQAAKSVGSAT